MTPSLEQVKEWFTQYNSSVFADSLPPVKFILNNTRRQLGQFFWGNGRGIGIKISLYWDRPEEEYRRTLLHEMCHLWCYNRGWIREHHGPHWKQIAAYVTKKTELQISRCTDASDWKPRNA
ncbi:MAG: SprT-like domain-containing protein [Bacteroidales bacterium]|nr:SprT-like domain-containing protein [Bacteroidales bacterium]